MEMKVRNDKKIVEIWLTKAEKNDPELRAGLKDIFAEWKKKRYTVGVYESGGGDLYQNTRDLLVFNKKRLAELETRKVKQSRPEKERVSVLGKLESLKAQAKPASPAKTVKRAELEL